MSEQRIGGVPAPWWVPNEADRAAFTRELVTEVAVGHPLHGLGAEVVNRCGACDEVLVSVGPGNFGMLHLTWSGKPEPPPWPKWTPTGGYVATELAQAVHGSKHTDE